MDKLTTILVVAVCTACVWLHGCSVGQTRGAKKLDTFATQVSEAAAKKIKDQKKPIAKASEKEAVRIVYRDRFIPTLIKETEYVTSGLASCPVSDDAVRMWNQIRLCTLDPSSATCEPSVRVPDTGPAR